MEFFINNAEIKLIIFDFDHTMYGETEADNIRKKEFSLMIYREKYKILTGVFPLDSLSLLELESEIRKLTINFEKEMHEIQNEYIFDLSSETKRISNGELKKLKKDFSLNIVTNNTLKYISHYCKILGIDLSLFDNIYSNEYDLKDNSKTPYYKKICQKKNISPSSVLVIGDSYNSDIMPALNLGCSGILVERDKECEKITYELIKNLTITKNSETKINCRNTEFYSNF